MRKPKTDEEMHREIQKAKRFIDIAFIFTIIVAVCITIFFIVLHSHCSFSQRRWQARPQKRIYMVQSLLKKHKLTGMSRSNVRALLGYDQHMWENSDGELTYYLGTSNHEDNKWLILHTECGIVTSYSIQTK